MPHMPGSNIIISPYLIAYPGPDNIIEYMPEVGLSLHDCYFCEGLLAIIRPLPDNTGSEKSVCPICRGSGKVHSPTLELLEQHIKDLEENY